MNAIGITSYHMDSTRCFDHPLMSYQLIRAPITLSRDVSAAGEPQI